MIATSSIQMAATLGESVCLKDSDIQGVGLFAKEPIAKDSLIHYTHVYHDRYKEWVNLTPNYKYNHSKVKENCDVTEDGKIMKMTALRDIAEGEEILVDYTKNKILEQPEKEWTI